MYYAFKWDWCLSAGEVRWQWLFHILSLLAVHSSDQCKIAKRSCTNQPMHPFKVSDCWRFLALSTLGRMIQRQMIWYHLTCSYAVDKRGVCLGVFLKHFIIYHSLLGLFKGNKFHRIQFEKKNHFFIMNILSYKERILISRYAEMSNFIVYHIIFHISVKTTALAWRRMK